MTSPKFQDSLSKTHSLIKKICQESSESQPPWHDWVDNALLLCETLSHGTNLDADDCKKLDPLCINLWNKSVNLKTKGTVTSNTIAKLRRISYHIICLTEGSSCDDISLKKQLMMGLKTSKACLEVNDLGKAEAILGNVNKVIQKLQQQFIHKKESLALDLKEKEKSEIDQFTFQILCSEAELLFAQGRAEETFAKITSAKAILQFVPDKVLCLNILCYNFGVECYDAKSLVQGIMWLRESYNIGKETSSFSQNNQAKTLRLLAKCYMDWQGGEWKEKALNALTLANDLHPHISGLYLKCCHLITANEDTSFIKHSIETLIQHSECDMNLCLNLLQILKKHKQSQVAFDMRHFILHAYQMNMEYGNLLVSLLDLFIDDDQQGGAQTFSEECIEAHASGQRLDDATKRRFHVLFWNKAAGFFESLNFEKALHWYHLSLSLYSSLSHLEENLDKLQRNIATCYLRMGHIDKAMAAIEMSERCNPNCAHTCFIAFKIAFDMGNAEKAASYLHKTVQCVTDSKEKEDVKIICLAAHTALQSPTPSLAIPALECFISKSPNEKRLMTAIKCLIRLQASSAEEKQVDVKVMLVHLKFAHRKLIELRDQGCLASAEVCEDASWFMKMCWNVGLHSKGDDFAMKEFFTVCGEFLSLCPVDMISHEKHQNCQLLSSAACLKLARKAANKEEMEKHLNEALQHAEEYRQADRRSRLFSFAEGAVKRFTSADMLMMVYEFEALSKLNDPRAEKVLEEALAIPQPDPKLFKTLSVLGTDAPASNNKTSIRALRYAVQLYLNEETPNFAQCSEDIRHLMDLYMNGNKDDEALMYLRDIIDLIERQAEDSYPIVELLWLMTRSWNNGLLYYNCNRFQKAELWCSQSMRLLKFLPFSKGDYEQQMMSLYSDLLTNVAKSKEDGQSMEE